MRCPALPLTIVRSALLVVRGYNLAAEYVIHTVGPVYDDDETSAPLLANCYR